MSSPINLQSNYPVLAEQEREWQGLLREAVERFSAESLKLAPFGGWPALRVKAAAWVRADASRTFVCECGHHGLLAAMMAAGLPGKTIAVETLTYPWFVRQIEMLGCRVVPIAMDEQGLLPEALRSTCEKENVAAVYLMPSMHNPTGAVAGLARRNAMVEVAREFNAAIIEDAAYSFLVEDEPARYYELAPERAYYVESLSKRAAPGLRTGFLVVPESVAENAEMALRVMGGSSTLLASLGCAMAEDGRLATVIHAKRVEGRKRCAEALKMLAEFEVLAGPDTSWHLWVTRRAEDLRSDEEFEAACAERGVLVTGARWFTAPGAVVPHAVRIGLGGETEWSRVEEGLQLVVDVLRA